MAPESTGLEVGGGKYIKNPNKCAFEKFLGLVWSPQAQFFMKITQRFQI